MITPETDETAKLERTARKRAYMKQWRLAHPEYAADKFTEGMTWDNHGDRHLDHILPLAYADLTDREQFLQAAHYTNMQPLWAVDNLAKGCKIGGI